MITFVTSNSHPTRSVYNVIFLVYLIYLNTYSYVMTKRASNDRQAKSYCTCNIRVFTRYDISIAFTFVIFIVTLQVACVIASAQV